MENIEVSFFGENRVIFQGEATGRLDVMGGIADYSGARVLQKAIREKTTVKIAFRTDKQFRILSRFKDSSKEAQIHLDKILKHQKIHFAHAQDFFRQHQEIHWTSYIIGCFLVVAYIKKINLSGFDILVESHVPIGKGVSSSAALEIATMRAIERAYQFSFEGTELARLAQQAENFIAGAPCGLMDQLACHFGKPNALLPIDCRPDILHPLIEIPKDVYFIGIDSGVSHSVKGTSYTNVRTAAFMGYTIIALKAGCTESQLLHAKATNDRHSLPYHGYLANISPSEFEKKYRRDIPFSMEGTYFLKNFGTIIDNVTSVTPKNYVLRNAVMHPIHENYRVILFQHLLMGLHSSSENQKHDILIAMGELMYQSHESYAACGLGDDNTDTLVEMVQELGPEHGLYGAKITGGGSGGTVCILAYGEKGLQTAKQIHQKYQEKVKQQVAFFD
ncbi:MAG: hypothetical protein NZM38_01150 [Cytophagales bacterium]|nr:hypothetical protein [Cytophagales bacterium]MDW8383356.1 hypothetical protein [Flammeovirgaceae bacterium]